MNTRDLDYLVALAETLHFGRAAERCNASQPALSGQLKKLEERLGVKLFERDTRNVQMTEIGARIAAAARAVLLKVDELEAIAATQADPLEGAVTLGMPPTIGPYLTPLLLPAAKAHLAGLRFELVEDFTHALEGMLVDGALDIAILATPPARAGLAETLLYDEPFRVALPPSHPLAAKPAVDLGDLADAELLLLADGHCLRDQVFSACGLDSARPGAGPQTQKTSLATILALVAAGDGVTLAPALCVGSAGSGVAIRPESSGAAGRTVRLTHRKSWPRMAVVEALAALIHRIAPDCVSLRGLR